MTDGHLVSILSQRADGKPDLPKLEDKTSVTAYVASEAGDLDRLTSHPHTEAIYPARQTADDHTDTLTTLAYGAALFAMSEDRL